MGFLGAASAAPKGPFLGVSVDGNSKIAMVAPLIIGRSTLSPKIGPIAPAVWAVGGAASDLGSPHLIFRLRL